MYSESDILGLTAGFISLVGAVNYARTIAIGTTKPFRATWIVWFFIAVIILKSQISAGATVSLYKAWAEVIGFSLITVVILVRGRVGWTILDFICLVCAFYGLYLWQTTGDPESAFYIALGIDFITWLPILIKTIVDPKSEDTSSWALYTMNSFLALIAVYSHGNLDPIIVIYPWYFFLSNMTIWLLSMRGSPRYTVVQEG